MEAIDSMAILSKHPYCPGTGSEKLQSASLTSSASLSRCCLFAEPSTSQSSQVKPADDPGPEVLSSDAAIGMYF